MYRWTHTEQSRPQRNQNLPKKLDMTIKETEFNSYDAPNEDLNTTVIDGDECEKLNAIKLKLLQCSSVALVHDELKSILNDLEKSEQKSEVILSNGKDSGLSINSDDHAQIQLNFKDTNQQLTNNNSNSNVYQNNDQENCDSKVYRTFSTQTEQILLAEDNEKNVQKIEDKQPSISIPVPPAPPGPPAPPAPPPPPMPNFLMGSMAPKTVPIPVSSSAPVDSVQTNKCSNPPTIPLNSSAILSNASSFCIPPPPPMNGIPGPPPLPLPSGNMWFKSDSKLNNFLNLFVKILKKYFDSNVLINNSFFVLFI